MMLAAVALCTTTAMYFYRVAKIKCVLFWNPRNRKFWQMCHVEEHNFSCVKWTCLYMAVLPMIEQISLITLQRCQPLVRSKWTPTICLPPWRPSQRWFRFSVPSTTTCIIACTSRHFSRHTFYAWRHLASVNFGPWVSGRGHFLGFEHGFLCDFLRFSCFKLSKIFRSKKFLWLQPFCSEPCSQNYANFKYATKSIHVVFLNRNVLSKSKAWSGTVTVTWCHEREGESLSWECVLLGL